VLEAFKFDGNVVDVMTIAVGIIVIFLRPIKRAFAGKQTCFTRRDCVADFLNGIAIVPFFVLVGSLASKGLMEEALKNNKVALAAGGVIGLFFVIGELLSDTPPPNGDPPTTTQPK